MSRGGRMAAASARLFPPRRGRSSRGGNCPRAHYVAAAMAATNTPTIEQLFAAEPDRLSRLSFEVAGLYFDWSKTHLDQVSIDEFTTRAERMGFAARRDALFAGGIVNPSEGRAATHVAERGSGSPDEVDLA